MTELLEQALEAVRTKPPAAQDDIARGVLRLAARERDIAGDALARGARRDGGRESRRRAR